MNGLSFSEWAFIHLDKNRRIPLGLRSAPALSYWFPTAFAFRREAAAAMFCAYRPQNQRQFPCKRPGFEPKNKLQAQRSCSGSACPNPRSCYRRCVAASQNRRYDRPGTFYPGPRETMEFGRTLVRAKHAQRPGNLPFPRQTAAATRAMLEKVVVPESVADSAQRTRIEVEVIAKVGVGPRRVGA